jgi:hypothetical protein
MVSPVFREALHQTFFTGAAILPHRSRHAQTPRANAARKRRFSICKFDLTMQQKSTEISRCFL